jgi:serine/threonine protein kinase
MSSSSRSRAVPPVIGGGSVIPKGLLLDGSRITVHRESLLGEGGFAKVYRATVRLRGRSSSNGGGEERTVAFKRLNDGVKSFVGAEMLAAELKAQSAVDAHPNIVKVLAAVDDQSVGFGLVLELAHFGTLFQRLQDSSRDLPWDERTQILQDVAAGVQALHDHRPAPIVHSDLKSMNILLFDAGDGSAVAKVGRS